jgi:hypothetical protein
MEGPMNADAGAELDREIVRRVPGLPPGKVLPYSTDDSTADVLLWKLAQCGVAFKVQRLDGRHFCMLWRSPRRAVATGTAETRPLAICRAILALTSEPSPSSSPADDASFERREGARQGSCS